MEDFVPRPHADGLTKGNLERCRRVIRLPNNRSFESRSEFFRDGFLLLYILKIAVLSTTRKIISKSVSKIISKLLINSIEFGIIKNRISARNG